MNDFYVVGKYSIDGTTHIIDSFPDSNEAQLFIDNHQLDYFDMKIELAGDYEEIDDGLIEEIDGLNDFLESFPYDVYEDFSPPEDYDYEGCEEFFCPANCCEEG